MLSDEEKPLTKFAFKIGKKLYNRHIYLFFIFFFKVKNAQKGPFLRHIYLWCLPMDW